MLQLQLKIPNILFCTCIAVFGVSIFIAQTTERVFKRVCYYNSYSVLRPGLGTFNTDDIDSSLCTHIIYAFADISYDGILEYHDPQLDLELYQKLNTFKVSNPKLKTLLAVGGWVFGSGRFSNMSLTLEIRKKFANSAVMLLRKYEFDGLDLDWEFPTQRDGSRPEDKEHFTKLAKEIQETFQAELNSKNKLLLTAALSAQKIAMENYYDISALARHLDFINFMTYDLYLYENGSTTVGHHSPLHGAPGAEEGNIDWSVQYALDHGVPKEKLVIGIPFYGRTWSLENSSNDEPGAPATGKGSPGPYTKEEGALAFYEICTWIKENNAKIVRPPNLDVPYAVAGTTWIAYDDEESIKAKAEYIRKNELGGAMVWAIDQDDFKGTCMSKHYPIYPLLNTIKDILQTSLSLNLSTETSSIHPLQDVTGTSSNYPLQHVKYSYGNLTNYTDQQNIIKDSNSDNPKSSQFSRDKGSTLELKIILIYFILIYCVLESIYNFY